MCEDRDIRGAYNPREGERVPEGEGSFFSREITTGGVLLSRGPQFRGMGCNHCHPEEVVSGLIQ